jgi:hypothetical protein
MTLRVYDPSALRLHDESFIGLQEEGEPCDCFSNGHEFCIEFCHFTRDTPIPFTMTMYFILYTPACSSYPYLFSLRPIEHYVCLSFITVQVTTDTHIITM